MTSSPPRDLSYLEGRTTRGWLRLTDRRYTRFAPVLTRVLWLRDHPNTDLLLGRALLSEPLDLAPLERGARLEFWNVVPDWPLPVWVRGQTPITSQRPSWLLRLVPLEQPDY